MHKAADKLWTFGRRQGTNVDVVGGRKAQPAEERGQVKDGGGGSQMSLTSPFLPS